MGDKELSDGNESVMTANLEEDAEVKKSWHPYLKLHLAHHCDGVDFAGPFVIKLTRRVTVKRYRCLFTWASTRAVHLEIFYSLDTASFLNAFSRMAARRGKPEVMISDNGTNFTSAERELSGQVSILDQTRIKKQVAYDRIQWRFNPHPPPPYPPLSPPVYRVMEEFSKPLSSLLRKPYAQSLENPELRMKSYWPLWSK